LFEAKDIVMEAENVQETMKTRDVALETEAKPRLKQ
jgi:hypothetical protein